MTLSWHIEGAEKITREHGIDRQNHKKVSHFPPRPNWDLARNLVCFYRFHFRYFTKVQENIVLLQKIFHGDKYGVLTERSLKEWRWNLPFNSWMHAWSQADLAAWEHKLGVWVCDRALKIGDAHAIWDISVHVIDMDLLFFSISLLTLNR